MDRRSWFGIDGTLEPLDYEGPSFFRFPETLAEHIIERYSAPGDWVLDPFCGFGTTLVVAERMARQAVGCEVHDKRAAFSASRISDPERVLHGPCEDLAEDRWPPFALLIGSPPYHSFSDFAADDDAATYQADIRRLFSGLVRLMAPGGTIAVVASQVRDGDRTRPVVWEIGTALTDLFPFREELVRVNTSDAPAGPGYDHDHVLIFDVP